MIQEKSLNRRSNISSFPLFIQEFIRLISDGSPFINLQTLLTQNVALISREAAKPSSSSVRY